MNNKISLENLVVLSQSELFDFLCNLYVDKAIFEKNGFILVPGEAPIMLLAHLDTVHEEVVKQICTSQDGDILMSPQGIGGDDRCGVYALLTVYDLAAKKPWLLFTCDEETGGKGADKFCNAHLAGKLPGELDNLKMLIEVDRKGSKDAVYYDCANEDFEKYITSKGFKTARGSFSDISFVAPELGIAAVNLSSGYYNAHTLHEYIVKSKLDTTISRVLKIVEESDAQEVPQYEYMEAPYYSKLNKFDYCYDIIDFLDDYGAFNIEDIPVELREAYAYLLDFYSYGELEYYRKFYGEKAILQLYEEEGLGGMRIEASENLSS